MESFKPPEPEPFKISDEELSKIVKVATQTAIEVYRKHNEDMLAKRNEKAVKNTVVLLEGYVAMKQHCMNAIAKSEETLTPSDLQAVLYEVFNRKGFLQIESILASKRRTELIIYHIDEMMKVYKEYCIKMDRPYYDCVHDRYIDSLSISEIAEKRGTSERNVYNWLNAATEDLAIYFFGAYAL